MSITPPAISGLSAAEKRKLLAELLERKARADSAVFPVSYAQQALLYFDRAVPGSPVYNAMLAMNVRGPLQVNVLRGAFQSVLDRHPGLRTNYALADGIFMQRVHDSMQADFRAYDSADWSADELDAHMVEEAARPYDLGRDSTVRLRLYSHSGEDHILMLGFHHIGFDYWSFDIFMRDLASSYARFQSGAAPAQAPPRRRYTDYVLWQREMLAGARGEQLWKYWQRELTGELPVLHLPTDRPRPASQTFRGMTYDFKFDSDEVRAVRSLARQQNTTLYVVMLAAFQVLLHRYSHQDDFVVGSAVACRTSAEFEDVIGYFANVLPLRVNLANDPPFATFLSQVRRTVLGALEHQDYPLPLLVEKLGVQRDPRRSPLFDVAFSWDKFSGVGGNPFPSRLLEEGGSSWPSKLRFARQFGAPYDLTCLIFEDQESLSGTFLYNTDLFDADTMARMAGHFRVLLQGIVSNPDQRASRIALLTPEERKQLVVEWNATQAPYPENECVHELLQAQAEKTPTAIAVRFEDESLTYRELNLRSNQLAHHLRARGVGPDVLVGLCVERSLDMLIGLFAILKAGGAYVPLDPAYPPERLNFLLQDSEVSVLVTHRAVLPKASQLPQQLIYLDEFAKEIAEHSWENPNSGVTSRNLAYLIYTSGSTGVPKGVLIEHRGLRNIAEAQAQIFRLQPSDRLLQFASLSFDASIFEIIMAVRAGGMICLGKPESLLPGPALSNFLRRHAITIVTLPSSALAILPRDDYPALRIITAAGDACPAELVTRWAEGREFFNLYGPTEATIWSTFAPCADANQPPPIGRPIPNTKTYVLDSNLQPVPIGIPGQLHLSGVGLARGYHRRPELNDQRFVANPFDADGGSRMYKTGDLVRWMANGNLEFIGRIDRQVKIRGFRIELGEIETLLVSHPDVDNSVVVAREDSPGTKRLVAYVLPNKQPLPPGLLRSYLKERLPDYMVPALFVTMKSLPLSPAGKVDLKALPTPESAQTESLEPFTSPQPGLEEAIAAIWRESLGLEKVSRYDNFFDLGGHSLVVAQMHDKIEQVVGRKIPVVDMFQFPTISSLVAHLSHCELAEASFEDVYERVRQQKAALASRIKPPVRGN